MINQNVITSNVSSLSGKQMKHVQVHSIHPKRLISCATLISSLADVYVQMSAITDGGKYSQSFSNIYVDGDEFDIIISRFNHIKTRYIFDNIASYCVGPEYITRHSMNEIHMSEEMRHLSQLSKDPDGYYDS